MPDNDISRIIVFNKNGATAKGAAAVASSFPKSSSLFPDLGSHRAASVPLSYVKEADRANAPLTFPNLGITLGYGDQSTLKKLNDHPAVSYAARAPRLGSIRPVRVAQAVPPKGLTWGLQTLGVQQLWKQGLNGEGVMVGHLDTGVDASHPALKDRVAEFAEWDFLGGKVGKSSPHDSATHGTHTAGTICGVRVQGRSVGIAPGAKLCSGLVIEGGDATARVLGGLDWLVGLGVRVISMSLGFPGYNPVFTRLVDILVSRNIVPVFAIGNEGPNSSRSPGNYPQSFAVGAIDQDEHVALFSSSQHFDRKDDPDKPDCVAPGVGVISAKPGGGWQEMDGTSMATPHVAGLVALLLQAKPNASAPELQEAILASAVPITGEPPLRYGHGVVHAVEALKALQTPHSAAVKTRPPRKVKSKRARKAKG
ncbi:MAG TPA: S8 family serine peptidase [Bryobacteraceae bacterium]|nr:S8 family serine peptidase [Bryobacteraceae bacterium]